MYLGTKFTNRSVRTQHAADVIETGTLLCSFLVTFEGPPSCTLHNNVPVGLVPCTCSLAPNESVSEHCGCTMLMAGLYKYLSGKAAELHVPTMHISRKKATCKQLSLSDHRTTAVPARLQISAPGAAQNILLAYY